MKMFQEERNSLLADLKYQIKGGIAEITENVNKKMKENYTRSKELHLSHAFFFFGYLSLL